MDPLLQNALPWVEKYRPDEISKMYGQTDILSTIKRFMAAGQIPNLLLHGPAGTGKTTAAVAVCKQIFGNNHWKMSCLELNASDERGIDVVRDRVKQFAQTASFGRLCTSFVPRFSPLFGVLKRFSISSSLSP